MSLALLIDPIARIVDKLIPDKEAAAKAKLELMKLEQQGQLSELQAMVDMAKAQASINQTEAAHRSLFVAGWRPFIGWMCGFGIFWVFLGEPVASYVVALNGSDVTLPETDFSYLFELVLAMLGMGGLRTYEKLKGVAREK